MTELSAREGNPQFGLLLDAMPSIAEAVAAFPDEALRLKAFDLLTNALGVKATAQVHRAAHSSAPIVATVPESDAGRSPGADEAAGPEGAASTRRRKGGGPKAKRNFSPTRGLNFAPDGHPSLEAFSTGKAPAGLDQRNLAAVYYLTEHMGLTADVNNVLAVFQAAKWECAAQPDVALRKTASVTGWIDTSDSKDIKLLWAGRNFLESKMPVEAKKKQQVA
jgi:hypothetical protein